MADKHKDNLTLFRDCAKIIINNWTALQLALENGMGERNGPSLAAELPESLTGDLLTGAFADADDVAEKLFKFMDFSFMTVCEDGSCDEIGDILWNLHILYTTDNRPQLESEFQKLSSQSPQKSSLSKEIITIEDDCNEECVQVSSADEGSHEAEPGWKRVPKRRRKRRRRDMIEVIQLD